MWLRRCGGEMATDEYISYEEAFEILCGKAGVQGRGIQVQPGTMHLYGYDSCERWYTDDDRQQHRDIANWLEKIVFTGQKYSRAEFERHAECYPAFAQSALKPEGESAAICSKPTKTIVQANKSWKTKLDTTLTPSEASVLDALNVLWPDGQCDHKAKARDKQICEWLKRQNKSAISTRVIQRARTKIRFS